ncbi:MAG: hypothetical protein ACXW2W_05470 [Telluria sp.]
MIEKLLQGFALNGTMLHEVRMLMEPYQKGTVSSLVYPISRIRFTTEGQEIRLWFPAMLALELYRSGILPQDASEEFSVSAGGKKVGNYRVIDFR